MRKLYSDYIGGVVTTFPIPGSTCSAAGGINNLDQCVEGYSTGRTSHGYMRDADGTLHYPIDAPGAAFPSLLAISDKGEMVGGAEPKSETESYGVYFSANGNASYQYPGAVYTKFTGINSLGLISGDYQTADGLIQGFIVRVR